MFLLKPCSGSPFLWKQTQSISSVQSLSHVWLCDFMDCSKPGFLVHRQLLELAQTNVHWVSDAIQPSHPLSSPSMFPSIFSSDSVLCIRWPKYWSFSFSISPWNEYSGLISFRMDWLDLLAVQGTLKSLLILWCSLFFMVQLSCPYMTTGKTIALTRRTFVDKVMSLLFNMFSRLVIAFLPRSKRLLISWLQSPYAVFLESKKIVRHCFYCFPIYLPRSDGTRCHDLQFLNVSFKPAFSLSSFTFIMRLFGSLHFLTKGWCHLHIWGYWYSFWQFWFQLCFIQSGILHDTLHISQTNRVTIHSFDTLLSQFGTHLLFHVQF